MTTFKNWLEIFLPNSVEQYNSCLIKVSEILIDYQIILEDCTSEKIDEIKEILIKNESFIKYNSNGNIGTATLSNYKKFLITKEKSPQLEKDEIKWTWTSGTPTNGYNSPYILCEVIKLFYKYKRGIEFNNALIILENKIKERNKFKAEKDASLVLSQDRDVLTQFGQYWKFFNLTNPDSREVELTKLGLQIADEEKTIDDFIEYQINNIQQNTISNEKVKSLKLILQLLEYLNSIDSVNGYLVNEELINILPYIYLNIFSIKQLANAIIYFRKHPNSHYNNINDKLTSNETRFVEQHFLFLLYSEKIFKSSLSQKGYSLNRTIQILNTENIQDMENENFGSSLSNSSNLIKAFHDKAKEAGLFFSIGLIRRFVASLCSKQFVILTGLSGSGKTKLALSFAQWICNEKAINNQYCIIPVGADWTNREPLLGFPSALDEDIYVKPQNYTLDIITNANKNPQKPYFLILDEMNLSHVERYFADFLSSMESGAEISLHNIKLTSETEFDPPQQLIIPKNLFIIGTVNIDETTYMFSPKVLDRANTIEFRLSDDDMLKYIKYGIVLRSDILTSDGINYSDMFLQLALDKTKKEISIDNNIFLEFFKLLKNSGAEFGYRTANEIGKLIYILEIFEENENNAIDIAIMQKLLPKLHGSRNKLSKILPIIGSLCLSDRKNVKEFYLEKYINNDLDNEQIIKDENIKFKLSFEKICRMYRNSIENGFASYAEA